MVLPRRLFSISHNIQNIKFLIPSQFCEWNSVSEQYLTYNANSFKQDVSHNLSVTFFGMRQFFNSKCITYIYSSPKHLSWLLLLLSWLLLLLLLEMFDRKCLNIVIQNSCLFHIGGFAFTFLIWNFEMIQVSRLDKINSSAHH